MSFLYMQKSKLSKLNDSKDSKLKKKNVLLKTKTLKGSTLREYKQTITLNQIQKEVLVGTLLGYAWSYGPVKRLYTFKKRETYVVCQFCTIDR